MALRDDIARDYPGYVFLLDDPEVGPLLTEAVNPQGGYSPETFRSKLYQTRWFRERSESQRAWLIMSNTDPGQAAHLRSSAALRIANVGHKVGFKLDDRTANWYAEMAMMQGWEPEGPEMMEALRKARTGAGGSKGWGDIGIAANDIRALAEGAWFQRPSARQVDQWAEDVAFGLDSIKSINARMAGVIPVEER